LWGIQKEHSPFMKEQFKNFTLRPPLFYLWKLGVRFEISKPWVDLEDKKKLRKE